MQLPHVSLKFHSGGESLGTLLHLAHLRGGLQPLLLHPLPLLRMLGLSMLGHPSLGHCAPPDPTLVLTRSTFEGVLLGVDLSPVIVHPLRRPRIVTSGPGTRFLYLEVNRFDVIRQVTLPSRGIVALRTSVVSFPQVNCVGVAREVPLCGEGEATDQTLVVPGLEVGFEVSLHVTLLSKIPFTLWTAEGLELLMSCTVVVIEMI